MIACETDSVETVEALLRGGADSHLTDVFGRDASLYSVSTGNQRITQLLQNGGKRTTAGNCAASRPLRERESPGSE